MRDNAKFMMVTIRTFLDPVQAQLAAGLLESEGIPVNLLSLNHGLVSPLQINALGGFKLQVPENLVPQANEVLENRF